MPTDDCLLALLPKKKNWEDKGQCIMDRKHPLVPFQENHKLQSTPYTQFQTQRSDLNQRWEGGGGREIKWNFRQWRQQIDDFNETCQQISIWISRLTTLMHIKWQYDAGENLIAEATWKAITSKMVWSEKNS